MAKNEIGDWFQYLIWMQLQQDQSRTKPTPMVHQFVDSKAARGFVSAQPSDFLITYELGTVYLEVKASEKHTQLPMSMIRDQQIAHAALIGGCRDVYSRLLNPYQFLFFSEPENTVTFWDGDEVVEAKAEKRKLSPGRGRSLTMNWAEFDEVLKTNGLIYLLNWG